MALRLTITAEGAEEAALDLARMGRRAVKATPAMVRIMRLLLVTERVLWRVAGRRWARLDRDTRRRKLKTGHVRPLIESGRLERSLTQMDAAGAIREAHDGYLEFGTSVAYARYQHRGEGRRMPARPLLPKLDTRQGRMVARIVGAHVLGDPMP